MTTDGLVRGCGRRKAGCAYLMTDLSPYGLPLSHFLFDPPKTPEELGVERSRIAHQGISMIERILEIETGTMSVFHAWDFIGAGSGPGPKNQGYWFVPDWIEEGLRYGWSTLIPSTADFSKLTVNTRVIAVHPHCKILNPVPYWENTVNRLTFCLSEDIMTHTAHRAELEQMAGGEWPTDYHCISHLWQAVDVGETSSSERHIRRLMPWGEYDAWRSPPDVLPVWELGVPMWRPISRIEVVQDPNTGRHEELAEKISKAQSAFVPEFVEE